MMEYLQSIDPDVPVIIVASLGLLLFAVVASVVISVFVRPIERRIHQAAKQIHKLETGKAEESEIGGALKIVGGIALLMLTFIGVLTIAKGLGLGAMGKGIGILAFTGGAAALWTIYALVRRGHAKWVFGGLGFVGAVVAAAAAVQMKGYEGQNAHHAFAKVDAPKHAGVGTIEVSVGVKPFATTSDTIPLEDADEVEAVEVVKGAEEKKTGDEQPTTETEIAIGEAVEPVPDWMKEPIEYGEYLITSEAFLSEALARDDAVQRLTRLAVEKYNEYSHGGLDRLPEEIDPQNLWDKFITHEHVECRKTSFGDTFVFHARGVVTDEIDKWFSEIADRFVAEQQRSRGLIAVSASGGGVLLALSALYGVLSLGEKRSS